MARSDRLLSLVQHLRRHRRPVTAETLAQELEVSVRTIYRDIATLIGNQVPIRGEAGIGYVLEAGFDLPPMMLTPDEIEAILVGMHFVRNRGDASLARAADDVVAKVGAVLPEALRPVLFEGSLFAPAFSARIARESVDMAPLREAIRKGLRTTISYEDAMGKSSRRTIWPFALAYFDAVRVVVAWCEMREAFRNFRTDRISNMKFDERYPARRAELLRRWQQQDDACASSVS
ncbi:MAG: YafY family transcriptional regulator [Hyphomicrobiales bacterium]|nr:YafY family transcriptional regulator [Hyphomicrobiales bacterium]